MINPAIVERSEETMVVWDACLSFLFVFCQVVRHREVTVRYQDLEGAWHELEAGVENDLSELLQHEIDHLNGIMVVDRMVSPEPSVAARSSRRGTEPRARTRGARGELVKPCAGLDLFLERPALPPF
jgi:peptide deformylase